MKLAICVICECVCLLYYSLGCQNEKKGQQ